MLQGSKAFSGFSVKDLDQAEEFYSQVLELDVKRKRLAMVRILPGSKILQETLFRF